MLPKKVCLWYTNPWFLLSRYLGVGLPCCRVDMYLTLVDKTEQVFRALVPLIPPLTRSESSSCSMSLPILDMISLLYSSHGVVY